MNEALDLARFSPGNKNKKALKNKSLIEKLLNQDQIRIECFRDTGYYCEVLVLNCDFNFYSTAYRALKSASLQSLSVILRFLEDEGKDNTMAKIYNDLLMMDFTELVEEKADDLRFFLNEPEKLIVQPGEVLVNMELDLFSVKLDKYSTFEKNFMPVEEFKTLHDIEDELIKQYLERIEKQKQAKTAYSWIQFGEPSIEYPIEYTFIDLRWLIIGEKLKHLDIKQADHKLLFDDDYFSEMINT